MSGARTRPAIDDDDGIARVAGNRAGVVEWANDAFSRLTGIPLAETLDKPVTRFLERAGIELEVVDFVAQHFFEGRPCRLEFPYERPDGRRIEVLLEVEPLRDATGEIDRFAATARALAPARRAGAPPARDRSPESRAIPVLPESRLDAAIHRVVRAATADGPPREPGGPGWLLDLDLAAEPLAVRATEADLDGLIADLLEAARAAVIRTGHAWGTITLATGRTNPGRRFHSKVHAIPAYPPALAAAGPRGPVYLEIHDTGEPLAAGAREGALARALESARALGASVHLDATPGCGHQVLVLFPA